MGAYGHGPVLFKPTLAAKIQSIGDFAGALSYFATSNNATPEDNGFAIKNWTAVRFENEDILISGTYDVAMGNYFFNNTAGAEVRWSIRSVMCWARTIRYSSTSTIHPCPACLLRRDIWCWMPMRHGEMASSRLPWTSVQVTLPMFRKPWATSMLCMHMAREKSCSSPLLLLKSRSVGTSDVLCRTSLEVTRPMRTQGTRVLQ